MTTKAQQIGAAHAAAWEADAIAQCRQDDQLVAAEVAGDLCIPCMMQHPCLCDWRTALVEMRAFYEANRKVLMLEKLLPVVRAEPVLELNWGQKGDALMDGLYQIAREPYVREIARLQAKIEKLVYGDKSPSAIRQRRRILDLD